MNALPAIALVALAACAQAGESGRATYVGTSVCATCHATQAAAWQGTHHQLAMAPVSRTTVLAPFEGEMTRAGTVTSTFLRKDSRFVVRTDDADGRLREFEVKYSIGVAPLQQYLVAMPDGSSHALPLAWDSRTAAQGGGRWFHLQGSAPPRPGDELHWTGRQANANFMCIECHVTGFEKNYDVKTRRYASRWAEADVGCEACHGPGSKHVDWSKRLGAHDPWTLKNEPGKGLVIRYDQRKGVRWTIDSATGNAKRSPDIGEAPHKEADACARCHSHRSRIAADEGPARPLLDAYHPSTAEPGLFWSDGQMRAEVYNQVSFMQSRMHAKGVTCSDCHEPHALKLRLPGNALCLQCHAAPKYDVPAHHFHAKASLGAQCVACHMPNATYMSIDRRHDHFIRVPQPALSQAAGSPDACTQCHAGKPRSWAIAWTMRWYPHLAERASKASIAMLALDRGDWDVMQRIESVLGDVSQPAVSRASVLERLPAGSRKTWSLAAAQLGDKDSLVRRAAAGSLREAPLGVRIQLLTPMLDDPVRDVRIEAARWLAAPRARLPEATRMRLERPMREYIDAQYLNADSPEAWNNLGTLWADQGEWRRAESALRHAEQLAPGSVLTRLNLADVYRAQGREAESLALIRATVESAPRSAAALQALGQALLRKNRTREGLDALRSAQELQRR